MDSACRNKPLFKVIQLSDETGPNFQIWPSGAEEFKRFAKAPSELPHVVCSQSHGSPALPSVAVDQAALSFLDCLLNEVEDAKGVLFPVLVVVKKVLRVCVNPQKREVLHNLVPPC